MRCTVLRMDRHVADINFNNIVQQQHFDDAGNVDTRPGLICKDLRIKSDVPTVLARVFKARTVAKRGGAVD